MCPGGAGLWEKCGVQPVVGPYVDKCENTPGWEMGPTESHPLCSVGL